MNRIITLFVLITLKTISQNQSYQWVRTAGSSTIDIINSVKADGMGNIYCTGQFQGVVDFDPGPGTSTLSSFGSYDAFVSKFNSAGVLQWVKQIGGINQDVGNSIDIDNSGNVLIVGNFRDVADFDPSAAVFNLTPQNTDVFVLKLTSSGNFVWAKKFGGINYEYGKGISVDNLGNILTTGSFENTVDFDPGTGSYNLTAPGSASDLFVSKLDPNGNFVWARRIGGTNGDEGRGVDCDGLGNVLIAGITIGTVDLDPGTGVFTHAGSSADGITIKLDGSGNFLWANAIGAGGNDEEYGVSVDAQNNVVVSGIFNGTVDFDYSTSGSFTITSSGGIDSYVCKYNSSGGFIWAKPFKGTGTEYALSLTTGAYNDVYVSGSFFGTTNFDSGVSNYTLSSTGGFDAFAAKLTSGGTFEWAIKTGGNAGDESRGITTNSGSNVYVGGYFNGTSDFDPGVGTATITSSNDDMFLLNICSKPNIPIDSTSNYIICNNTSATLYAYSGVNTATLNWYSSNTSSVVLGIGSSFNTPTLAVGVYTYYVSNKTCLDGDRLPVTVTVSVCTDINKTTNENRFEIRPNPAKDHIKINIEEPGLFYVYDISGKLLHTQNIETKDIQRLELNLVSGLYICKFVSQKGKTITQKLIINN